MVITINPKIVISVERRVIRVPISRLRETWVNDKDILVVYVDGIQFGDVLCDAAPEEREP